MTEIESANIKHKWHKVKIRMRIRDSNIAEISVYLAIPYNNFKNKT